MVTAKDVPALATASLTFLGAFSRFTHGRYTPSFYQYQIDHAPDDKSTRYMPVLDCLVGTLLLLPQTRAFGALVAAFFLGVGVILQIQKKGIHVLYGIATFGMALAALRFSWE